MQRCGSSSIVYCLHFSRIVSAIKGLHEETKLFREGVLPGISGRQEALMGAICKVQKRKRHSGSSHCGGRSKLASKNVNYPRRALPPIQPPLVRGAQIWDAPLSRAQRPSKILEATFPSPAKWSTASTSTYKRSGDERRLHGRGSFTLSS